MQRFCCSVVILLWATSAQASWQWTNWKMTVGEVQQASNGTARLLSGKDVKERGVVDCPNALLTAPYRAGEVAFEADFLFGADGRLCQVRLNLRNPNESLLVERSLRARYGQPADSREDGIPGVRWKTITWFSGEDRVTLSAADSHGTVIYAPKDTNITKGL